MDGSGFSLLEAFQRHAVITGTVHPEHEQSFTATANALAHNELIVQLEKAIDESGDKNGRITGEEIAMARTKPLLANALSRMIVRFESHWSTEQDRWAALDEIMGHEWKGERERQTKRGWWNEVASKVDSFPQDPRVYHIHPFGWVDNFCMQVKRHPVITIDGSKIELTFLQLRNDEQLTRRHYENAANQLGCEADVIEAIAITETKKVGAYFTPGGVLDRADDPVPTILYERHKFAHHSNHAYNATHKHISSRTRYNADDPYGPYSDQYKKLIEAYRLHKAAALKAASWGRFQILGENYASCGFDSVEAFVLSHSESEVNHLMALVAFIKSNNALRKAVLDKDWATVARRYNGPEYGDYDKRMEENYVHLKTRRS